MLFVSYFVITLYVVLPYIMLQEFMLAYVRGNHNFKMHPSHCLHRISIFLLLLGHVLKQQLKSAARTSLVVSRTVSKERRGQPCGKMSGLATRNDEGKGEREEQTAQIYQAFDAIFHRTARNCSPVAHPGRSHRSSFCPKPSQAPLLHW